MCSSARGCVPSLLIPLAVAVLVWPGSAGPAGLVAQSPLARAKQRLQRPFVGQFTSAELQLELTWNDAQGRYVGTWRADGEQGPVEAHEQGGQLVGDLQRAGQRYRFVLRADGARFVLTCDGDQLVLQHSSTSPTPTPSPAPAAAPPQDVPAAPAAGVGIAFASRGDDLVVAQLLPEGPAARAKVPLGAVLRAIDGRTVRGWTHEQVRQALGGAAASLVTVTFETEREVLDVVLQRAPLGAANGAPAAPGAAAIGDLPAWLQPGVRVTYFSGSAQLPGVRQTLTEDEQGNWTDGTRRFRVDDVPGGGGAGFTQYDFVAVAPDALLVASTSFVYADAQLRTVARASSTALVGDHTGLGDLWVPPARLAAMRDEASPGHRVRRLRYPLGGQTYDAVTTQIHDASGYTRYTYDLATGLLLAHSHSSVGKAMPTPNANGTAGSGQGVTTIVHGHLRARRTLALPWLHGQAPEWLRPGLRLDYRGTLRNSLADGVMPPWQYGFTVGVDRLAAGGAVATLATHLDYGYGQPPQQGSSQVAYGPGGAVPLWLDVARLDGLQPGQVLDRDPSTGWQIVYVGRDAESATIREQGPLESQTYTYERRSGRLVATAAQVQQGAATLTIDVRQVR
jgi:hypothetical protein